MSGRRLECHVIVQFVFGDRLASEAFYGYPLLHAQVLFRFSVLSS